MKTSPKGREFIAAYEGVVLRAYKCSAGVWTIGIGRTAAMGPPAPFPGMTITREEAFAFFEKDLEVFELGVESAVTIPLRQSEFDALVSLAFNIGLGAFARSTLVRRLNASRTPAERIEAYKHIMSWDKVKGKPVRGLTQRRADEFDLAVYGDYAVRNGAYKGTPFQTAITEVTEGKTVEKEEIVDLYTDLHAALRKLIIFVQVPDFKAAAAAGIGYLQGQIDSGTVDKISPTATKIIRMIQERLNLRVDGIVGPATRAALSNLLNGKTQAFAGLRPEEGTQSPVRERTTPSPTPKAKKRVKKQ